MQWNSLMFGALICGLVLAGCGGESGPERVPVKGQIVMADGKPVFPGSIQFVPAKGMSEGSYQSSALLHEGGKFTMRTHPHGEGVVPGTYKVVLSLGVGSPRELAKYSNPKTTPLEVTIPEAGNENLKLTLKESVLTGGRGGPPGMRR